MPHIGVQELLVILLILVLLFGAAKLPQIGRGLGEGIRNFRRGVKDGTTESPSRPEEGREADDRAAS
jgi:sec-independent protein translocase protein TatA